MMSQKPGSKLNRGSNGSTRFENWTKAESRTDRTENELEIENGLSIRTCLLCGPEQGRELHTRNGAYWARAGYIGAHGLKQLALSFNSKLLSFFLFFFLRWDHNPVIYLLSEIHSCSIIEKWRHYFHSTGKVEFSSHNYLFWLFFHCKFFFWHIEFLEIKSRNESWIIMIVIIYLHGKFALLCFEWPESHPGGKPRVAINGRTFPPSDHIR